MIILVSFLRNHFQFGCEAFFLLWIFLFWCRNFTLELLNLLSSWSKVLFVINFLLFKAFKKIYFSFDLWFEFCDIIFQFGDGKIWYDAGFGMFGFLFQCPGKLKIIIHLSYNNYLKLVPHSLWKHFFLPFCLFPSIFLLLFSKCLHLGNSLQDGEPLENLMSWVLIEDLELNWGVFILGLR